MSTTNRTENILGYAVTTLGAEECVNIVAERLRQGAKRMWFACINPHAYVVARRDRFFADALRAADLLVPDGIGIVLAAKLLRRNIKERVTGSDVFGAVMARLSREGGFSVFLLGSTDETLQAMQHKISIDYPGVRVVGVYSPPFRERFSPEENTAMVEAVNRSGADVLWVAMTAPKQEKWIFENLSRLDVGFVGAVGAVFDFYTGRIKRPSALFRDLGLEWLVRFLGEPRRLWRRNLLSAPIFFFNVFTDMVTSSIPQRRR